MVLFAIEHTSTTQNKQPGSLQPSLVFEAEGVQYLITNRLPFVPTLDVPNIPSPVTVIRSPGTLPLTRDWLEGYLDKLDRCHVYDRRTFIKGVIITTEVSEANISLECRAFLKHHGNEWVEVRVEDGKHTLAPGPYVYLEGSLRRIYRLYDDRQGAFMCGIKPASDPRPSSDYQQLRVSGISYGSLAIAAPSQAPSLVNDSPSPLRVAVKDCYLLQGLKTSLCNRAYYDLSEPAAFTAEVVQRLVEDGAHILGLTKLSSMIVREEPMDAVDYPTAFDPRGDGYQSPAGSSSGSAVAVVAYDWLDCAIGTDTSGSGRRPAMANGVW
ncbi:hypothetical protein FVER14953_20104 [Fusarium verticillioides]|nr:hypothetical protein FVER14953_20104 [Fusarium verticillioides]